MKLLVVEDEHKIANSLKRGLEQESYICDVAYDGDEGLDLASSGEYDLIILDLMLPKMDGITITKKLRSENIHTPILMLTARGEIHDKINSFDSGCDDYLVKPFAFEELLARIKALSRRPRKILETKLSTSKFTLDLKTKVVSFNNRQVNLSKKEYQLLEYLIKNKGKIVSKAELISRVWDYDSNILDNTVEVFIKYLRNKLGKDSIKTARGFGYRID